MQRTLLNTKTKMKARSRPQKLKGGCAPQMVFFDNHPLRRIACEGLR